MALRLKKEFLSLISGMLLEVFSDDEDSDIIPHVAIQESLAKSEAVDSKIKEKKKEPTAIPVNRRALKEARYLQKTRFEKYEEPTLSNYCNATVLCSKTYKPKDDCFCPDHIDVTKMKSVSVVVVQKGEGSGLSDLEFKTFWKMSRSTVEIIYGLVNPPGTVAAVTPMELLTVLWHIVSNDPLDELESRFNTPKDRILQLESIVFERLCCLRPRLENWPAGEAAFTVMGGFESLEGLRAIGAIGNVHFPCEKAPFNPKNFANSMGYATAVFQLVIDHRGAVTRNSYFFWPGSNNPLPDGTTLKGIPGSKETFLVGGFECSNSKRILIPYWEQKLSHEQEEFNRRHANCLNILQLAVLLLVSRFKVLTSLRMAHADYVRQLVASCVLLHNLCIDLEDTIDIDCSLKAENFLPPVSAPKKSPDTPAMRKRDQVSAGLTSEEQSSTLKRKLDIETKKGSNVKRACVLNLKNIET